MRSWGRFVASVCFLAALLTARTASASPVDLLLGARIVAAEGVERPECVHDGVASPEGGRWNTINTTRLAGTGAFLVLDLGRETPIDALWVQGDNNDDYIVDVSSDGVDFAPGWHSLECRSSGTCARSGVHLGLRARYLKLHASGGDGQYGVSELQAFEATPTPFPDVPRASAPPVERNAHNAILLFGATLIGFVCVAWKRLPGWALGALALAPLLAGLSFVHALPRLWPMEQGSVALVRGVVALVAAVAVGREALVPPRFGVDRRAVVGVLAVCAAASFASFYSLGSPQFWDAAKARPTFVHYLDLRQYYPTAKYFREIGYRHVYEADVEAYLEDTGKTVDAIASMPMRDLDTHEIRDVGALRAKIAAVSSRFSPAQWAAYKRDARFMRATMGTDNYFVYLVDYGGNATPVWIALAHAIFLLGPSSEMFFVWTGLLDPLLLLATFYAIGRTFGVRTALVCVVLFGSNDFIMYGSNWAGATLRHDWLAYLGLGACALRRERWMLGGALLAASATIRAFPGVALVGVLLPPLVWAIEVSLRTRRLPSLAALRAAHGEALRVLAGAGLAIVCLFAASLSVASLAAWVDWSKKVALLSAEVHATHVGLRAVLGGWESDQADVLRERWVLVVAATAGLVALVLLACRRRGPAQAAMIALLLVPVLMYPANYYLHMLFLLPIGATVALREEDEAEAQAATRAKAWIAFLLMCVAQYFATLERDYGIHFFVESSLLIATMLVFLGLLAANPPAGASRASAEVTA